VHKGIRFVVCTQDCVPHHACNRACAVIRISAADRCIRYSRYRKIRAMLNYSSLEAVSC
jgi:hypothetical protein